MSFDKENVLRFLDTTALELADGKGPQGWVYFIVCMDAECCKIGFTQGEVSKRVKALQTGSSSELLMLAKHPGTPATERKLHERFAAYRMRGEWFELTDELRAYIIKALWAMSEITITSGHKLEPWMVAGVQLVMDELGCISESLEEALEATPA